MKRETITAALNRLDDRFICEAAELRPGAIQETPERKTPMKTKRILTIALAAALILALGATAYAERVYFGWGKNMEISVNPNESGVKTTVLVHTDDLTEPVCLEEERLFFIVNGEHIDITDQITQTQPFIYSFVDEDRVIHYWIIGKNGPEIWHFGYAEYIQPPEGDWMAGYVARTNNNTAPWLENAWKEIGFPMEQ